MTASTIEGTTSCDLNFNLICLIKGDEMLIQCMCDHREYFTVVTTDLNDLRSGDQGSAIQPQ